MTRSDYWHCDVATSKLRRQMSLIQRIFYFFFVNIKFKTFNKAVFFEREILSVKSHISTD